VEHEPILPAGALSCVVVGLSISGSPDLGRLGLGEVHVELALGEVTRSVLLAGGRLVYGGHLEPEGYTAFLISELEKYGHPKRPLVVCLAWQEHRERSLDELEAAEHALDVRGKIEYLALDGATVDKAADRDEAPVPVKDPELRARALTAMRRHVTELCDARVLMGGRREGFQGTLPGVIEEARLAIEAGQPVFFAGGFGGAVHDAAQTLGLGVDGWPKFSPESRDWHDALCRTAEEAGWEPTSNGLTHSENLRLAATHRPSDVATLVALGLGRLVRDGKLGGEQ
jgi:hypothetical protein